MRRTLFGKSTELERLAPPRASVREALLFDVRDHEASTDLTLAERRAESWTFAPGLLLVGHLILATNLILQERPPASQSVLASVFVPLVLALLTDVIAGSFLLLWRRMQMAPHTVGRVMCGYIGATGVLWTMSSVAAGALQIADLGFITLAMASGFSFDPWRPSPRRRWRSSALSSQSCRRSSSRAILKSPLRSTPWRW